MTITYTIPGATLLDQLNEPTMDGMADENAPDNCVAASIAEALHILTGKTYDGDELKDAVYGQGYVGFQSASRYITYCHDQGVTLAAHNDTQAGLVNEIHAQVSEDHPVLVTMPSQWGTPYPDPVHPSGSTHVGLMVGVGPSMLRCMNPWHGFMQDEADAWWEPRLCEGQVWILQKAAGANVSGVPSGWTDDGTTLKAPNGVPVVRGMRAFVLGNAWDASDVPMGPEVGVAQVEIGDPSIGGGVIQFFEKSGQLSWSPTFNGGQSYRTWNGKEESALRAALDAAQEAEASAQSAASQAQQSAAAATAGQQAAQASLSAANAQIAQLQAQIAALKSQPAPAPTPAPAPANPAPTTPADAAALLVSLIYAEAAATLKAAS